MAKTPSPKRLFKVTILCDGKKIIAYDIRAVAGEEAKDEAWSRYELAHGRVDLFDERDARAVDMAGVCRLLSFLGLGSLGYRDWIVRGFKNSN